MQVDRELFMEQGFLILRDFIPRDKLDAIRASAEIMLERQKEIWRRERKPGDPPGGEWGDGAAAARDDGAAGDH